MAAGRDLGPREDSRVMREAREGSRAAEGSSGQKANGQGREGTGDSKVAGELGWMERSKPRARLGMARRLGGRRTEQPPLVPQSPGCGSFHRTPGWRAYLWKTSTGGGPPEVAGEPTLMRRRHGARVV